MKNSTTQATYSSLHKKKFWLHNVRINPSLKPTNTYGRHYYPKNGPLLHHIQTIHICTSLIQDRLYCCVELYLPYMQNIPYQLMRNPDIYVPYSVIHTITSILSNKSRCKIIWFILINNISLQDVRVKMSKFYFHT